MLRYLIRLSFLADVVLKYGMEHSAAILEMRHQPDEEDHDPVTGHFSESPNFVPQSLQQQVGRLPQQLIVQLRDGEPGSLQSPAYPCAEAVLTSYFPVESGIHPSLQIGTGREFSGTDHLLVIMEPEHVGGNECADVLERFQLI